MASATRTATEKPIFDQLCEVITRERGATNASLETAHVLAAAVGPNELVGLEAGGERAVFRIDGEEPFAAAFPFDETGIHDRSYGLGLGVEEGLACVVYE